MRRERRGPKRRGGTSAVTVVGIVAVWVSGCSPTLNSDPFAEASETGGAGQPCNPDGSCGHGLTCVTGACVVVDGDEGPAGEPGGEGEVGGEGEGEGEGEGDPAGEGEGEDEPEVEGVRACPQADAVSWLPDAMLWVATEAGLQGYSFSPLFSFEPLVPDDSGPIVPLPEGAPGEAFRWLRLFPDGLWGLTYAPHDGDPAWTTQLWLLDLAGEAIADLEPDRPGLQGLQLTAEDRPVSPRDLAVTPDGRRAVALIGRGQQAMLAVIDVRTGARLDLDPNLPGDQDLRLLDASAKHLVVTLTGRFFVAGGRPGVVWEVVLDPAAPAQLEHSLGAQAAAMSVQAIAPAPDGTALYVAGGLQGVRLDLATDPPQPSAPLDLKPDPAHSAAEVRAIVPSQSSPALAYAVAVLDRGDGLPGRFHVDALALDFEAGELAGAVTLVTEEAADALPTNQDLTISRDGGWLFAVGATPDSVEVLPLAEGLGEPAQEPLVVGGPSLALATRTWDLRELCDGLDQDCDGQVDEDFWAGDPCDAPGVCGAGVLECQADPLAPSVCSTAPGQPRSVALDADPCDGADNDCDGETDEDPVVGEAFRLSELGAPARLPDVTFVQVGETREFAVAWQQGAQEESDIRFRRVSLDGVRLAEEETVAAGAGGAHLPRIAWDGHEHGLVWSGAAGERVDVRFRRVPFSGREPGLELDMGTAGTPWVGVAATEVGWAVLTHEFLRIVTDDSPPEPFSVGIRSEGSLWTSVARSDDGVAMVATLRTPAGGGGCGGDRVALTIDRCDAAGCDGQSFGETPLCGRGWTPESGAAIVVAAGTGVAATFEVHGITDQLQVRRFLVPPDASQISLGIVHDGGAVRHPAGAWSVSSRVFAAVWDDTRTGVRKSWLAILHADGTHLMADIDLSEVDSRSDWPRVAWGADRFAVVWTDGRDGVDQVYMRIAPFVCDPGDEDSPE